MNVLAVGCHPDDVEVNCAGTLVKYKKQGHNVAICHVTNGNMGHVVIGPDELREIRIAEAKKSGELAGIEVVTCDFGDLLVHDEIAQRDKITEVIRFFKPDVLITHSPNDYMPDHVAVGKLVFDASFAASVPHYGTGEATKLTPIYYMDTLAGVNFMPTEYVDISDEIDTKLAMLECHVSQMKWMRDHDGIDFAEFVRTCARFRGLQCQVKYAEAFTQCYAWPKIAAARLLP
ncbi:MAG: PIG-L family deacetylase [Oscillospiraceae bacterium]|nr:PIG-L family deacetylase [Oscillospiraceae bacterium]